MCGAAGNVGFHLIRRQLAAPEAIDEAPIDDLSAVPADLGFSMRFHPTALLDALVDHVVAVESSPDFDFFGPLTGAGGGSPSRLCV